MRNSTEPISSGKDKPLLSINDKSLLSDKDRPLLSVKDLSVQFGGIRALDRVDLSVEQKSITALIGPNGAGKTTVFNCLTGFYLPTRGAITLNTAQNNVNIIEILGETLQPRDFLSPKKFASRVYFKMFGGSYKVARAGIARTFQNIRLFKEITTMENLLVPLHNHLRTNNLAGLLRTRGYKEKERKALNKAWEWLEVMGLVDYSNRKAGQLSYGLQRRLEIARAMCTSPELLCLDEPAAGLNPNETEQLSNLILKLRDKYNVTVLIIEHDMSMVMEISDHVIVLNHGQVISQGSPEFVQNDKAVLSAYLGTE